MFASDYKPLTLANPFAIAADILDPPEPGEDELLAEVCSMSLRDFVREAWVVVEAQTRYVSNWHIDCICEHLEAVTAGELPRLLINQPPRTMKSRTVGVFWPAWEWMLSPATRWLYASYASELAERDSRHCRRLIKSVGGKSTGKLFERIGYQGVLRLISGGITPWQITDDQDAQKRFESTESGMRMATGRKALGTGEGGDRIVIDDPLSAEQARSEVEREACNRWWDETMSTRKNSPLATQTIVMQRLHENDLSGHVIAQDTGWHHLCLPGEYEPKHIYCYPKSVTLVDREYLIQTDDDDGQPVTQVLTVPGGRELQGDPRTDSGEPIDPVRLSEDKLKELRTELGAYGYAGQIQQIPSPQEGGMFKRTWWKRYRRDEMPPQWLRVVTSWDMTFKETDKASASYVVGGLWGVDGADRYLLALIRGKFSFVDSVKAVRAMAGFRIKASAHLVEEKANGSAVISTLQRKITGMIPIEPDGGKEARAAAIEPIIEGGNVYVPAAEYIPAPAGYEPTATDDFIQEFAVFPNGTHDDMVDMTSQALTWLEAKKGGVSTQSRIQAGPNTVVRRGDLVLIGDKYIDKP